MQDIMTSLAVSVQSGKQSIQSQLPFALRFVSVFEVKFFEFRADIDGRLEFSANFSDVFGS